MHNKFGVHKYLIIVTRKIKKVSLDISMFTCVYFFTGTRCHWWVLLTSTFISFFHHRRLFSWTW